MDDGNDPNNGPESERQRFPKAQLIPEIIEHEKPIPEEPVQERPLSEKMDLGKSRIDVLEVPKAPDNLNNYKGFSETIGSRR
jgi:hypothetical protein